MGQEEVLIIFITISHGRMHTEIYSENKSPGNVFPLAQGSVCLLFCIPQCAIQLPIGVETTD